MAFAFILRNKYLLGLVAIIIVLILYKLPFIGLPYYWDEAWPYSVAVHTLYNHGLSFMPTAIPPIVSRGHPLMFHFLSASWMKIFGTGLIAGHSFALFISIITLISVYLFGKKFFSERAAFIACMLLGVQAIFISQSAFLMPEMLMALWVMVCCYAFFDDKKVLFVIATAAMLLTKESGAVFILTLGCSTFLDFIISKEKKIAQLMKLWGLLAIPVFIASIYFIAQKISRGWFLFPLHTSYLASQWIAFKANLPSAAAYLFIYYGRNGFSLFILLSLILTHFVYKSNYTDNEKRILPVLGYFIAFYLLFSSVNYFIPRYLLCAFPPFIIAGTVIIDKAFSKMKFVYPLIVAGVFTTCLYFYTRQALGGDNNYTASVKTDLAIVRYCEHEHLNDKYIFGPCVLRIDLTEVYAGYLTGKPFKKLQSAFDINTEYCIFSNKEDGDVQLASLKKDHQLMLIKKTEYRYARCELYKVIR